MHDYLPVISLKKLTHNNPPALRELKNIMHETGFFYLVGHGIEQEIFRQIFSITKEFFLLSEQQKEQISIYKSRHYRGYSNLNTEKTHGQPDYKETFDVGLEQQVVREDKLYQCLIGPNQWPQSAELSSMKNIITNYIGLVRSIGDKLMKAIAYSLELDGHYFKNQFCGEPFSLMRLIRYHGHKNFSTQKIGIGEHCDFGCLVLLLQDEIGGLEVQMPSGAWILAKPIAGSLVINIGDMLALWTNNYFKATPHRVINSNQVDRYSIPFFYEPNLDTRVMPTNAPTKAIIYGEHMLAAFQRSFPDHVMSTYKFGSPEFKSRGKIIVYLM
jgi:isopenicillin N synthase-like dioxygenase